MVTWNNLDTLASFKELEAKKKVQLAEVMSGENGAERVKIQCADGRRSCL